MDTKKILIYAGGAVVLGAVTYFVWAFFQKPVIPIGQTLIKFGSEEEGNENESTQSTQSGSGKLYDFTPIDFKEIEKPNVYDIKNFPLNNIPSSVSNP